MARSKSVSYTHLDVYTRQDKRSLLDWTVRRALRALPGVDDVYVLGGQAKSFVVVPDRARLLANGLHFSDLVHALERNNRNDGAGRINAGENAVVVRVEGALQNESDIGNVVVKAGMPPLRVKDLATVRIDAMTRYGAVTRDGQQEAVEGIVVALRGADASKLEHAAEAKLNTLQSSLPPGVKVADTYTHLDVYKRQVIGMDAVLRQRCVSNPWPDRTQSHLSLIHI